VIKNADDHKHQDCPFDQLDTPFAAARSAVDLKDAGPRAN
jgi:hypothetical protein